MGSAMGSGTQNRTEHAVVVQCKFCVHKSVGCIRMYSCWSLFHTSLWSLVNYMQPLWRFGLTIKQKPN